MIAARTNLDIARLDYIAPASLAELYAVLASATRETRFLAGGQSLVPDLKSRGGEDDALLVDLGGIADLHGIHVGETTLSIGAMTNFTEVLRHKVATDAHVLAQALSYVGSHSIRNRATLGGNLAWGDPRAELSLALMLYDANIVTSHRTFAVEALSTGPFKTCLEPGELILRAEIDIARTRQPGGFMELLDRHSIGKAIVSAGISRHDDGRLRIGISGLAERPVTTTLENTAEIERQIDDWLDALEREQAMLADPFHGLAYRRAMARLLLRRVRKAAAL